MTKQSDPTVARVAIVCADDKLRTHAVAQLRQAGVSLTTHLDLPELVVAVEQCDVVLIFADGLPTQPLLSCLRSLESTRSGPALIVVTDDDPPAWTPKLERDRLAVTVTLSVWTARGLDLVQPRDSSSIAADYSGPELPFTD